MSNHQETSNGPDNQSPTASEQPSYIARAVLAITRRMRRALSPWVQRWLQSDSHVESRQKGPFVRRQTEFTTANTRLFLARVENRKERGTVWQPDVGSLEPAMVDRFASTIADRFKPLGTRYQPKPLTDQEALELPLANMATGLVVGDSEPTPSLPPSLPSLSHEASPMGRQLARPAQSLGLPTQPPVTQQPGRRLPPKSRLFSRVEEVTPGSPPPETLPGPEEAGREARPLPPAPEPDLSVSTTVEAKSPDQPAPQEVTSEPSGEPSAQRQPDQARPLPQPSRRPPVEPPASQERARPEGASEPPTQRQPDRIASPPQPPRRSPAEPPTSQERVGLEVASKPSAPKERAEKEQRQPASDQPTAKPEAKAETQATSRRLLPLTESLPLFRPRLRLSVARAVQPQTARPNFPLTPVRARSWLSTRGWRFKKAVDTPAAPDRIARAVEGLEQNGSSGQPLSPKPRRMMERAMGQDLSHVRVHTVQLAPLNVQAATRGRDVYVEPGQDRFETPKSLALLGHELTHVSQGGFVQTKPVAQTAILPQARVQAQAEDEEAMAESNEQTILGLFQGGGAGPGTPSPTAGLSQPAMPELGIGGTEAMEGGGGPVSPEELADSPELFLRQQASLQLAAMEMTRRGQRDELAWSQASIAPEGLATMTAGEVPSEGEVAAMIAVTEEPREEEEAVEETKLAPDLDKLARQVYPHIKRLLAVERERRAI